jgi:hypothetical protein
MIGLAGLAVFTVRHYGISTDEDLHQTYGRLLWDYYASGLRDDAVFRYENLYLYGGLVDLAVEAAQRLLPFHPYDTRHLVQAGFGLLGIAGTFATARWLAGASAGLLAAVLLSLSGVYWGGQFTNGKDVPFAAGMIWLAYFGCRLLAAYPRPGFAAAAGFGAALGLTLGVRVGALLAVISLALAAAVLLVRQIARCGAAAALGDGLRFAVRLLPAFLLAYALMAVFWPWSALAPLNPLRAVTGLTHFAFIETLFAGRLYPADQVPPGYLAWYLAIKLPEAVLLGVLLAAVAGGAALAQGSRRMSDDPAVRGWPLLGLAVAVPLCVALLMRPALYNGVRHFLFLAPPLCVIAAAGWTAAIGHGAAPWPPPRRVRLGLAAALAALLAVPLITLIRLHPFEYVYYNSLAGGVAGADRRYELDYWSTAVRAAIPLLAAHLRQECGGRPPTGTYAVGLCTRSAALTEWAPPFLRYHYDWKTADFIIATTSSHCDTAAGGRVIADVQRLGVTLLVIKDRRTDAGRCR